MNVKPAEIKYSVRKSKRAKRLQLKINRLAEIEVVIPVNQSGNSRISMPDVELFVENNLTWIRKQQQKIIRRFSPATSLNSSSNIEHFSLSLPTEIHLPLLGEKYFVKYNHPSTIKHNTINVEGDVLSVFAKTDDEKRKLLQKFLHDVAKVELRLRLDEASEKYDLPYNRLFIRAQKTRWGSCSSKKNINLNRSLLFLHAEQVEYLLIHELCHTVHLNHSAKYWQLVSSYFPEYKKVDHSLKRAAQSIPLWAIV